MEALNQLAAEQTQQAQPEVNQNVQEQQPVVNKVPDSIPYHKFSEVVAERNALREALQNASPKQTAQDVDSLPPNATVDDLLKIIETRVEKKLNQAYESKVKPVEEYVNKSTLISNVEAYYGRNPEAAKIRQNIDAYFDTLSPDYQNFIKSSVRNGDTAVLDNLYYTVVNLQRANTSALAQQSVQQNSYQAQAPQNFKTIRSTQPSFGDKIALASKFGAEGNIRGENDAWNDVFKDVLRQTDARS